MKSIFIIFLILSLVGCISIQPIEMSEINIFEKTDSFKKAREWIQIGDQMSENGNYWFIDNVGNFSIIGQTKEDKYQWRQFKVWKVFYDEEMPRGCFGKFKNGEKVFNSIKNNLTALKNDYNSLKFNCMDGDECLESIVVVSHQAQYDFEIQSQGELLKSTFINLDRYFTDESEHGYRPKSYSNLIKSVLKLFNKSGLNLFEWKPKNVRIEYLNCSV